MIATSQDRGAIIASRTCRILIMAALPQEVRPFLRRVRARPRRDLGLPAWEWEPEAVVVALSGMGGVAAGRAGETLISCCRPELLISLGFGGALTPELAVGDVVLGATFWHYDPDTRELKAGSQPSVPRSLTRLSHSLEMLGRTIVAGSVVTTTRIIHKGSQSTPLSGLPHPVLDLETGVLAELAAAHGLPFLSLRAITDTAWEEIPEFLRDTGDPEATVRVRKALTWLVEDFRRVNDLLRLWSRSSRASQALAEALAILVPLLLAAGCDLEGQPSQERNIDKDSHPA
jgi:adenosylhomocysteine nucleosidase